MKNKTYEAIYRAHTNIALIKYWGKRNQELYLPMTSSLSLTLESLYTDTAIKFDANLAHDTFSLDGKLQDDKETEKVSKFVDLFREYSDIKLPVAIESVNHVPTAAGLASSASAFAALASAINAALGLELSPEVLSTFARQGSGSSTRSLFGGLAIITDYPIEAPYDDAVTYSLTFDGTGPLVDFTVEADKDDKVMPGAEAAAAVNEDPVTGEE